ncbi:MAG: hypothetical protein OHK0029_36850 [Armatimonadaceae bacterium]
MTEALQARAVALVAMLPRKTERLRCAATTRYHHSEGVRVEAVGLDSVLKVVG